MYLCEMKSWLILWEIIPAAAAQQYNTQNNTIEKKEIIHFELDGDFGLLHTVEGVLMVDHHLEIIT